MRKIKEYALYRHFKGTVYQVLKIASHTETGEKLVIYRKAGDSNITYARPYEMFASPVDREKYPDANQEYRFEEIDNQMPEKMDARLAIDVLEELKTDKPFLEMVYGDIHEQAVAMAQEALRKQGNGKMKSVD